MLAEAVKQGQKHTPMSETVIGRAPGRVLPVLDRIAAGAVLVSPLLLLHAHGIAEAAFAIAGLCFLSRSFITHHWAWVRTPWLVIGWAWWAWLIICSLPVFHPGEGDARSMTQALLFGPVSDLHRRAGARDPGRRGNPEMALAYRGRLSRLHRDPVGLPTHHRV